MGERWLREEEKMRFCNVGRRRCLVLAWRLAVRPAVAATAFLIASPWQRFSNNLSFAASSGSIGARPLKLGTGPAQYRCSRPLLSPAGQDRASIFGEQRFNNLQTVCSGKPLFQARPSLSPLPCLTTPCARTNTRALTD
jgi:hypothetical protein